jgi:hypothetical protein
MSENQTDVFLSLFKAAFPGEADPDLDPIDGVDLEFPGRSRLTLELDPESGPTLLAEILPLPEAPDRRDEFLQFLLRMNRPGFLPEGRRFFLNGERVGLARQIPLAGVDPDAFRQSVVAFADEAFRQGLELRERLLETGTPAASPTEPAGFKAGYPIGGFA